MSDRLRWARAAAGCAALLVVSLSGCGEESGQPAVPDSGGSLDGLGAIFGDTASPADTGGVDSGVTPDGVVDVVAADVPNPDVPRSDINTAPCDSDAECETKIGAIIGICNIAYCDPDDGFCKALPKLDQICSDDSVCTQDDRCVDGECRGTPIPCKDDDPCTDDLCSAQSGCQFVPNADPCDDGDPCTDADKCGSAGCKGVTDWSCYTGECCEANGTPGCVDKDLTECVCDLQPSCCGEGAGWLDACVDLVEDGGCGSCQPPVCGDTICNGFETCYTCVEDCGQCASCGDNHCSFAENCTNCPADCTLCICGDGSCDAPMEDCAGCTADCGECGSVECGDGTCEGSETCASCAADCGQCTTCGDDVCNGSESCETCTADCGSCPVCGNLQCENGESCANCPGDCPPCGPSCGDDVCEGNETCLTCSADCGICQGDCCSAHGEAGCDTPEVTLCVCASIKSCCQFGWSATCVSQVTSGACGSCL